MDTTAVVEAVIGWVNRTGSRNGRAFDDRIAAGPPGGRRRNWAHYGVMVPGLPDPHRFFGVMSILGTPGVAVFANDHAITTTPADTVYTVSATAAMTGGQFFTHSIDRECEFRRDGSYLRFGDELLIEGSYPGYRVRRWHREADVDLRIRATDVVSHFAHIPGVYDHWSVLAQCEGEIRDDDGSLAVNTLCTVEYATGMGLHSFASRPRRALPVRFFTYHVLNVDDTTQVLLVQVLGAGIPLQRRVYVRGRDDRGTVYTHGFEFTVTEHHAEPFSTPGGYSMALPQRLRWSVNDRRGRPLIEIQGRCNDDYVYGLGAGFVGSYTYTGTFGDRPISGTAYMEYIDRR